MHQLEYELAGWIRHYPIAIRANECSPRIRPVVRSFAANIASIESAWLLLPYLVDTTVNSTLLSIEALHNVLGTFDPVDPRQELPGNDAAIKAEFFRLHARDLQKYSEDDGLERALARLDNMLVNAASPFVTRGVETALASQVLFAWTAVESLAKDLWIAAINYGPKHWTKRVLKSGPLKSLKDQEKSISYTVLQNFQYDLNHKMGHVLRDKIKCETADEVLAAYVMVFGDDAKSACPQDAFKSIQSLEAIRNLIAHQGGIIDAKFQKRMKNIFGIDLQIGRRYSVTGKVAGILTNDAVIFATGLVNLVESRLNECDADDPLYEI